MNANRVSRWSPFRRHGLGGQTVEVEERDDATANVNTIPMTGTKTNLKSKERETIVERVESWPEEARPLKAQTWLTWLYAFGDLLLVLLPLYFILLGVAVVTLNGKPTRGSTFGTKVETAMDLGPTMFPIVFAAITGRSMKMIARFLAERGSRISTLELLMASQSVWGTFESQLLMQRLTVVGVNLLFLWALSPLGGQASLRLMTRDMKDSYTSGKLRYMTTGPAATMWGLSSTYIDSGKFADAGALYTAALMAPLSTKLGTQDPWGNIKIPTLDSMNSSALGPDGWYSVPTDASLPEDYSSLVGLPIVGLPSRESSNFSLQYTYLSLDCQPWKQAPYPGLRGRDDYFTTNSTRLEELVPGQVWDDKETYNPFGNASAQDRNSFFMDTTRSYPGGVKEGNDGDLYMGRLNGFFGNYNSSLMPEKELTTNRDLLFVSQYATEHDGNGIGLNIATCSLSQVHVEALAQCKGSTCATTKLRNSLEDNRSTALTGLEHGTIMFGFAKQFPRAVKFTAGSSPTERFLANTSVFPFVQQVGNLPSDVMFTNLSLVSPEVFSKRLSLALNTFYQLSIQPTGYFGSLSKNLSLYGPDTSTFDDINAYLPKNLTATDHAFSEWWTTFDEAVQDIKSPFIGATTTADITATEQIFVCNFAWLALLLAASTITLVTGSVALFLKRKTLGPELFGFVTSMTYENPWVKVPDGGTMLDAMERARLLKDVEVCVADVRGNDDIGHIAFAAGVPLRKLERGRLYC
ncbi:hypothetical protein AA0120_g7569 [Alternaria tenuissima]|uniref:Uncharacterized protein n=1 Tax=Alternaria tenuissima TaxID=119927 RepID=A0A4Q4MKN5_9PLEO|nr:hypothetical protein AA0114_g4926 [Alternaria tenuissima]RYN87507.1 hypothetical protein AA0120_g7569 [Alternaria tenuissima]